MKKRYAIIFAMILAVPSVGETREQYCEIRQDSTWQRWLSDFSGVLSSTNPKSLGPNHYNSYASGSGPVRTIIYEDSEPVISNTRPKPSSKRALGPMNPIVEEGMQRRIRNLPPLDGKPRINQPEQAFVQLSPVTKKLLDNLPSGVGTEKKSRRRSVNINRGKFAVSEGPSLNQFESLNADLSTPTFQLEVKNLKPSTSNVDLLDKALMALNAGQYEGAIAMYKSVLQKDRRNRDALFGLATTYHKSGQKAQARKAYGTLLKYHRKFEPGLNNLLLLAAQEAPHDALDELSKLEKKSPDFDAIYAQKASIYNKMGNKEAAINSMIKALSLSPENNGYKYNLAVLLDEAGHVVKASELYQDLLISSKKGEKLPVSRDEVIERLDFITAGKAEHFASH